MGGLTIEETGPGRCRLMPPAAHFHVTITSIRPTARAGSRPQSRPFTNEQPYLRRTQVKSVPKKAVAGILVRLTVTVEPCP